jgi:hypothetical protein
MEKFGYGINVPDPQPWLFVLEMDMIPLSPKFILVLRLSTGCRRTATACYCVAVLRIRDVYPGSRILIFTHPGSRISDPKTVTKERGEKKFVIILLFVVTNFTKLNFMLFLKC